MAARSDPDAEVAERSGPDAEVAERSGPDAEVAERSGRADHDILLNGEWRFHVVYMYL